MFFHKFFLDVPNKNADYFYDVILQFEKDEIVKNVRYTKNGDNWTFIFECENQTALPTLKVAANFNF